VKQGIYDRIRSVTKDIQPINVRLSAVGTFHHSKRSNTVWLDPSSSTEALKILHTALQNEFSECNADQRPFTPHLSVGQAKSDKDAQNLGDEIKKSILNHLSTESSNAEAEIEAALEWHVDQIYVIERKGYHGRFKIVGTIKLGEE
jgi:2'-5' RNA ligase